MSRKSFHWEIVFALFINIALILIFFLFRGEQRLPKRNQPVEIAVDISDFTPPIQKSMSIPDAPPKTVFFNSVSLTKMPMFEDDIKSVPAKPTLFLPLLPVQEIVPQKTFKEHYDDLARIEDGVRTFDGFNQVKAGIQEGTLPAGHRVGTSFRLRSDSMARSQSLKKHGGSPQTESAVEKALNYLASKQNPDGSWGSEESLKTGDVAALSSLALLTFFSHGESFQSKKYEKNIKNGCDFLIELSSTPNIEYAGKGFGHAILTYAIAEGFAMTGSLSMKKALERRLEYIVAHQNSFGSFALNYDNSPVAPRSGTDKDEDPLSREIIVGESSCDLSLLGWHIQAMTAAKNAGIIMPKLDKSLTLALEALIKIHQASKGGFTQGINMKRFPCSESMTAVGLLGMYLLNEGNSLPATRAARILDKSPLPKWGASEAFPLYRWYYQTQALFQQEKGRSRRWSEWNENLKKELQRAQQPNGSWPMPGFDGGFQLKNKDDLSIYSTCLCALLLQVYYRYLPSYCISENSTVRTGNADKLDLGGEGLISRLPGGADPMASVILGVSVDDMPPVKFGVFNGIPKYNTAPFASDEFSKLSSLRSTIPVRKIEDWPQTLQSNQRIAMFLDDLIPQNYRGHMKLLLGVVGTEKYTPDYQQSIEVLINGKRLYNSYLLQRKHLLEIVIPKDTLQPYDNVLQIRNTGKAVLAFDAAELQPVNKVGGPLFLLTDEKSKIPADLRKLFSKKNPQNPEFCTLSSTLEEKQLLPVIESFDPEKTYIGVYSALGSEHMGNDFQKHYLRQTGREIVDWIAGGGAGVKIKSIMTGGRLYDSVFGVEYPAVSALRQTAKLFEGNPRKLPSQIYPKNGENPGLFLSCAASYNAPGIATIVVAKRFPIPDETELIALIPWNGETEITIERGFLNEKSPFAGFATKLETETMTVSLANNIFRYSSVFPELTILRLVQKRAAPLKTNDTAYRPGPPQKVKVDYSSILRQLPKDAEKMPMKLIRTASGFASVFGDNASFSKVPATLIDEMGVPFSPMETESLLITFNVQAKNPARFDSVYLPLGPVGGTPQYFVFDVIARQEMLKKGKQMPWLTLNFELCGKVFSTSIGPGRRQKIVLPLKGINPSWRNLRILEPTGLFDKNLKTVSFEFNGMSVYYSPR
jgi:hypothetical protein